VAETEANESMGLENPDIAQVTSSKHFSLTVGDSFTRELVY